MAGSPLSAPRGRRAFLRSAAMAAATGALPRLTWADAGAPTFLSAAMTPNGRYVLCGLAETGEIRFQIPLPGRGHAAAAHPSAPLAVAFARRPGTFALVIDCVLGAVRARLDAPKDRHFYGHGAFDRVGARLFTCENAYETGEGVIGVWDVSDGLRRLGEIGSGGIGPHELIVDRTADRLIVANGGVRTHPDSGRAKLNLPEMRPNLAYLDAGTGALLDRIEPPQALRMGSLRHLAQAADGAVAVAAQWQGAPTTPAPLLALHRLGDAELAFLAADDAEQFALRGYAGSVAFSGDGARVGITSPRGGRLHVFDRQTRRLGRIYEVADVCGLAPARDGLFATDGAGGAAFIAASGQKVAAAAHDHAWDNHLVRL